jgi:hypothetical protein
MRVNPYPFQKHHAFILGFLTTPLVWLLFYAMSIYVNGVDTNYNNIFCTN